MTTGNFYYQDSLGNTSHVTDAVGNLLERYTYSAFGTPTFYYHNAAGNEITATVSNYGIKHLFQGQLWTQETGLNDYRNRVELPAMGVFLQPDPIGFKGDAANIYRFCGNDPVDRTDPMGLVAEKKFGPLTSFDGGDWVRGSDGLTADDWDHKHDQAGMDGGAPSDRSTDGGGHGGGDAKPKNLDDMTINQLHTQLVGSKDTTTALVPGRDGPEVTKAAVETKIPNSGDPTGAFGYHNIAEERFSLPPNALRTIHAHTGEGKNQALPSSERDYSAVQQSKGKPMYFTSRYLARHGADKGNYIILHFTGSRPLDIPRLEYRFDPRLTLPPLP